MQKEGGLTVSLHYIEGNRVKSV